MHTPYSDGVKWHAEIAEDAIRAGLDFIIVTDHNIWVDGVEGYYHNEFGSVLLLVGEEIHDTRRHPQANHFLAYGADKELSLYSHTPQRLIDETNNAGGCGFLAHPFDPAAPDFNESSLSWLDWDIEGYAGLEIWNYMSSFKGLLSGKLRSLRAALNPEKYLLGPPQEILDKWDDLLSQGNKVAAIGSSDAHGVTYNLGPFKRVLFPYHFLFRTINTHVLIPNQLSGDLKKDKQIVLDALGKGNGWVGYDLPHNTEGFRFSGQGVNRGIVGDTIRLGAGATLQVLAPTRCRIRIIHKGKSVAETSQDIGLTFIPTEPGAYRVECTLTFLGKERGWIYSNPIYLLKA
jgi:hypothetical protein